MSINETIEPKRLYLSSHSFSHNRFSHKDRMDVCRKYDDPKWKAALSNIGFGKRGERISKSAIRVAEVIKAKLDIDLFPLIIPVATKGFDMSGGTAAFRMIGEWGEEYLFEVRAKDCHSMKGEYYSRVHPATKEICIGRNR